MLHPGVGVRGWVDAEGGRGWGRGVGVGRMRGEVVMVVVVRGGRRR